MDKYVQGRKGLDVYEIAPFDSQTATIQAQANPPPHSAQAGDDNASFGKRAWPFAGEESSDGLIGLHCSSVALGAVFHANEPQKRLMSSQHAQEQISNASQAICDLGASQAVGEVLRPSRQSQKRDLDVAGLPDGHDLVTIRIADDRAEPAAAKLTPGDPLHESGIDLSFQNLTKALKELLSRRKRKSRLLLKLVKKDSFLDMIECVRDLDSQKRLQLLAISRRWKNPRTLEDERNPGASQLMAVLYLFTRGTPEDTSELMELLPFNWPPTLDDKVRQDCLNFRRDLVSPRILRFDKLYTQLVKRYGPSPSEVFERSGTLVQHSRRPELQRSISALAASNKAPLRFGGDSITLDLSKFLQAVQGLAPTQRQPALLELKTLDSFEDMVEFVKELAPEKCRSLLHMSQNWREGLNGIETDLNASQLMAILLLFGRYSPTRDRWVEFCDLLPPAWPPAINDDLRKTCLDWRAALARQTDSSSRRNMLAALNAHYGT
ncbi:hypothetical protein [Variovorax soli]|nr:hypothetical protein [Variovorax soli]